MQKAFSENFIYATANDYPYVDCQRNINYLSHFHDEIEIVDVIEGSINIICLTQDIV